MKFTYHNYNKLTKACTVCGRKFGRKPTADNCPSLEIRQPKDDEILLMNLKQLNRRLKKNAIPCAYADCVEFRKSTSRSNDEFIYHINQTELIDPNLPLAYLSLSYIPKELNPISIGKMRANNLEPKENAKPIAVTREWHKGKDGDFYIDWEYYYNLNDAQSGDSLKYITKSRLKSEYYLSDGWLKKLGEPDLLMENPHYKRETQMQLFKISRIRQFLQENAQKYSEWLIRRKKYVINALEIANRKAEFKTKYHHQNELCVKCKCSDYSKDGIFCVVNPVAFPPGVPEQRFCPDFED